MPLCFISTTVITVITICNNKCWCLNYFYHQKKREIKFTKKEAKKMQIQEYVYVYKLFGLKK